MQILRRAALSESRRVKSQALGGCDRVQPHDRLKLRMTGIAVGGGQIWEDDE